MRQVTGRDSDSTGEPGEGLYAPGTAAIRAESRTTDEPPDAAATVAAVLRGEGYG